MMIDFRPPRISGTDKEQFAQVRSYLVHQLPKQLSWAFNERGDDTALVTADHLSTSTPTPPVEPRWTDLGLSAEVGKSSFNVGRSGKSSCAYLVGDNGKHVYVAFNCEFYTDFVNNSIRVNSKAIPPAYRPRTTVRSLCPTIGGDIMVAVVNSTGEVTIEPTASSDTSGARVVWIDAYIDYWL